MAWVTCLVASSVTGGCVRSGFDVQQHFHQGVLDHGNIYRVKRRLLHGEDLGSSFYPLLWACQIAGIHRAGELHQRVPHGILPRGAVGKVILEITGDHARDFREPRIFQNAVDYNGINFPGIQRHRRLVEQTQFAYIIIAPFREICL